MRFVAGRLATALLSGGIAAAEPAPEWVGEARGYAIGELRGAFSFEIDLEAD